MREKIMEVRMGQDCHDRVGQVWDSTILSYVVWLKMNTNKNLREKNPRVTSHVRDIGKTKGRCSVGIIFICISLCTPNSLVLIPKAKYLGKNLSKAFKIFF